MPNRKYLPILLQPVDAINHWIWVFLSWHAQLWRRCWLRLTHTRRVFVNDVSHWFQRNCTMEISNGVTKAGVRQISQVTAVRMSAFVSLMALSVLATPAQCFFLDSPVIQDTACQPSLALHTAGSSLTLRQGSRVRLHHPVQRSVTRAVSFDRAICKAEWPARPLH